ncbi:MAG: hypothetical protein IJ756_04955 [Paludibacteraceae bacterium]|nr:hypothetical protein [Paludibacteraceae bacterium]
MITAKNIYITSKRSLFSGWLLMFLSFTLPAVAQEQSKATKKEIVKSHLKQHFQLYGFVRNYFTFDSRESYSGTGDLYSFMPKDENWNQTADAATTSGVPREDLNAVSTFRFLSLTTRLGLNIIGYKWRSTEFDGKIEADFYAGLTTKGSGSHSLSGTAQFRLRQAYMTLAWDSLKMGKDFARIDLLLGQAWHPMAIDLSDVIALNSGAPFGPFSRTPQVKMDARLGKYITLTGAALWQMQYLSIGPDGQSAEYIAYSKTPEAYLGLSVHSKGFLMRVGADVLSICPRHTGTLTDNNGNEVKVKVKDRLTTASPFIYLQYTKGEFSIKAKSIFAEAGEHMNLNGGYGIKTVNPDGSYEYTPTRTSSSWISLVYGGNVGKQTDKHPQKLQGILFGGYVHNFGTKASLATASDGSLLGYYYPRANNMNQMWRLTPTLLWTIGKFQLGCEYEVTSVEYGDGIINPDNGLSDSGLHWVTNHRVQLMTKYNF